MVPASGRCVVSSLSKISASSINVLLVQSVKRFLMLSLVPLHPPRYADGKRQRTEVSSDGTTQYIH